MGVAVKESTDRVAEDSSREEGGILEKADMRLIDAHDVIAKIEKMETVDVVDVVESIIMSPTVDAVSVIRCKDCVHFKRSEVLGNTCALTDNHVTKKDYCSKAERKEE